MKPPSVKKWLNILRSKMEIHGSWHRNSLICYEPPLIDVRTAHLQQWYIGTILRKLRVQLQLNPDGEKSEKPEFSRIQLQSHDGNRNANKVGLFFHDLEAHWHLRCWREIVRIAMEDLHTLGMHIHPIHSGLNRIIMLAALQEQTPKTGLQFHHIDFGRIAAKMRVDFLWARTAIAADECFSFMPDIDEHVKLNVADLYAQFAHFFECSLCQSNEHCPQHSRLRISIQSLAPTLKQHLVEGLDSYDLLNFRMVSKDLHSYANREIQRRRVVRSLCLCSAEEDSQKENPTLLVRRVSDVHWPFRRSVSLNFSAFLDFLATLKVDHIHSRMPSPMIATILRYFSPRHWAIDLCPRGVDPEGRDEDSETVGALIAEMPNLRSFEVMVSCEVAEYECEPQPLRVAGFRCSGTPPFRFYEKIE